MQADNTLKEVIPMLTLDRVNLPKYAYDILHRPPAACFCRSCYSNLHDSSLIDSLYCPFCGSDDVSFN